MIVTNPEDVASDVERWGKDGLVAVFKVCELCGAAKWCRSENPEGERKVGAPAFEEYEPYEDVQCRVCEEFAFRFPDVFRWITRVLAYQRARENKDTR